MNELRQDLAALSRRDLQKLAKQHGVKANVKSSDIVEELCTTPEVAASVGEGCCSYCAITTWHILRPAGISTATHVLQADCVEAPLTRRCALRLLLYWKDCDNALCDYLSISTPRATNCFQSINRSCDPW